VSATYRVTRNPLSLSSESITASDAGKLRLGAVGSPSRRAVALSSTRPCTPESARTRPVSRGDGTPCASTRPAGATSSSRTRPAALAACSRRARRLVTIQAQTMLTSYKSSSGTIMISIDTASGGVSSAAATAESAIA